MKAEIHVFQAGKQDVNKAAALFNQYRRFYHQEDDLSGAERFIRERLTQDDSVIFIADCIRGGVGEPAGFVQLYPSFSSISMRRIWILNDLYVNAEYRGLGIGRSLLDRSKSHAMLTGAKSLALSTHPDNLTARHLYESAGYVKDDEFLNYNLIL